MLWVCTIMILYVMSLYVTSVKVTGLYITGLNVTGLHVMSVYVMNLYESAHYGSLCYESVQVVCFMVLYIFRDCTLSILVCAHLIKVCKTIIIVKEDVNNCSVLFALQTQ